MELDKEINVRLEKELPRDVLDFINGYVSSPIARQAQKMLNYLFQIKFQEKTFLVT